MILFKKCKWQGHNVTQPLFRIEPEIFHKSKEPLNTSLNQHFSFVGEFLPLCDPKKKSTVTYTKEFCAKKKKSAKVARF